MTSFRWLDLTDLHCGSSESKCFWPQVKEKFFEDLDRLHQKCGPWDLVLFTGDITFSGVEPEFTQVNIFFAELWKFFKERDCFPSLLTVPGNHDLVRTAENDPGLLKLIQNWGRENARNAFWTKSDSDCRTTVNDSFLNYTNWWHDDQKWQYLHVRKPKDLKQGILPGDFSATIEKDGAKLGIIGLNTAFLQLTKDPDGTTDYYKGKLALDPSQFHEVCNGDFCKWVKNHHLCLLLTHHPPDWLNDSSKRNLMELTDGHVALHLFGHMHETAAYKTAPLGGDEFQRTWQGRSLMGLDYFGPDKMQRSHGYASGMIRLLGGYGAHLTLWPREAHKQGNLWNFGPDLSVTLSNEATRREPITLLRSYSARVSPDLRISIEHGDYLLIDAKGDMLELPEKLPVLTIGQGNDATKNAADWKKVHTCAESFLVSYKPFHQQLMRCQECLNRSEYDFYDVNRKIAEEMLKPMSRTLGLFAKPIRDLNPKDDGLKLVKPILINLTSDTLVDVFRHHLSFDGRHPSCSQCFESLFLLSETIEWGILMEALHMADQILESHFAVMGASSKWGVFTGLSRYLESHFSNHGGANK